MLETERDAAAQESERLEAHLRTLDDSRHGLDVESATLRRLADLRTAIP